MWPQIYHPEVPVTGSGSDLQYERVGSTLLPVPVAARGDGTGGFSAGGGLEYLFGVADGDGNYNPSSAHDRRNIRPACSTPTGHCSGNVSSSAAALA